MIKVNILWYQWFFSSRLNVRNGVLDSFKAVKITDYVYEY